jgi:hypothetical protein
VGKLELGVEEERCAAVWQPVISESFYHAFWETHKVTGKGNGDQLTMPHIRQTGLPEIPRLWY